LTWPFSVSFTIVWPPAFGPAASVPTLAYVSPPFEKKSMSLCGLPVGIVSTSSQSASSPPAFRLLEGGPAGEKEGTGWSISCAPAVA
jgi:hypothetical protein